MRDTTPVITIPVDETLKALDHGRNWIQDAWFDDKGGMCLHQGIRQCAQQPGDAYIIEAVANQQGWGIDWNDTPGRTFDDLKSRLVEHREIFPDELEAEFGPNWQSIVALARQAATLTKQDTQYLTWDTQRWSRKLLIAREVVSEITARATARRVARAAVQEAVIDTIDSPIAISAVADAARAIVVRDLITQEHYDILTEAWRSMFPNFDSIS